MRVAHRGGTDNPVWVEDGNIPSGPKDDVAFARREIRTNDVSSTCF